jgi:hypothetical protein
MAGTNGNGNEAKRKPFKAGEKEKHLKLLAKNYLLVEDLDEQLKPAKKKLKLVAEDIREGGYAEDDQTRLGIDDDQDEARQ